MNLRLEISDAPNRAAAGRSGKLARVSQFFARAMPKTPLPPRLEMMMSGVHLDAQEAARVEADQSRAFERYAFRAKPALNFVRMVLGHPWQRITGGSVCFASNLWRMRARSHVHRPRDWGVTRRRHC
ncbi:hypothetical protein CU560_19945 [Serratia ureilytica]|nr:hypothetical protein CU560_19945 [Serratia ureilytica]